MLKTVKLIRVTETIRVQYIICNQTNYYVTYLLQLVGKKTRHQAMLPPGPERQK